MKMKLKIRAEINAKETKETKKDTLHKDQRINPRRRYSSYKYIGTQHRSTTICKTNANKYERGN